VRVVDVDVVGAEAAQAVFDLMDDLPARQPSCRVEPTFTGLGRDHHLVASSDEGTAEELLGGFAFSGWCCPDRDEAERRFRLAQWTGTATSSTASASGTTIGFGRR
jgi:hypothetical protein